jgi:hypothetical protein
VTKPFKAILAEYQRTPHAADGSLPHLSAPKLAHLKRWAEDERANEVWNSVHRAAMARGLLLPDSVFIQLVLGLRDVATSINHRRNNRERYRKYAARMEEIAKVLRKPLPNHLLLLPTGEELAGKLDEAARAYRAYGAATRNEAGGMNWTRQSKPPQVYMRFLSNDLKELSGKWLDYEVAVLTEIAFGLEIDIDQVIWARRGAKRKRRANKGTK